MTEYNFRFEKSPKKKGKCPKCGQANTFRYYEDQEGNRLDESLGKCERINHCGYHQIPNLMPHSTKDIVSLIPNNQSIINPSKSWIERFDKWTLDLSSNFHTFCLSKGISKEHLIKHGVATDDKGKTVFVFRNDKSQVVNAKWFVYDEQGKRAKDGYNSHSMVQPKNKNVRYGMCLFGEEQLSSDKEKTVIIVESEKTKVIASFFYPEYLWLACGSNNGLTSEKLMVLSGRNVIWLCDADAAGRMNSSIKNLEKAQIKHTVIDLFPERSDGYDIADAILEGKKPEIAQKQPSEEKKISSDIYIKTPTVMYKNDYTIWVKTRNNWEVVANNFLVYVKYKTQDENQNCTWILEIRIKNKEAIYIEMSHEDFCSAKRMKMELSNNLLSFKINDVQLTEIQELIYSKTQFGQASKVTRYGFHSESKTYVFSNKVLLPNGTLVEPDKFGVVTDNKSCISLPQTKDKMKNRFFISDSDVSFNQWYQIYIQTHTYEKAFVPACFYIMSLFRDIVISHKGSSPILYLKGSAGTGKSSVVRNLTCLFGYEQPQINLKTKNTEAALVKLMSQLSNGLIWMDEFHNDFSHEGLLQAAYDNAGYHKTPEASRSNNETDSIDIYSALALTSNYIPNNPIFFSRCILIQIENKEKEASQRKAFFNLIDLEKRGLGNITVELCKYRKLIDENYNTAFSKIFNRVEQATQNESMPERLLSNICQALTCAYILQVNDKIQVCEYTEESDILDEFVAIALKTIHLQHRIQNETSVLAEFFSILQYLYDSSQIHEGVHFRFEGNFLLLRMPSIYPIFIHRYRNVYYKEAHDKESIIQEVVKMEAPRNFKEIVKTIRFKSAENTLEQAFKNTVTNSLSITYETLQSSFGVDLKARRLDG
ncbi:DUF6371 domain-containing protein [Flectobacillus major]|uniref:DUF6371 domain-containing protein n=1 Tax=Flectobacillus major TaxID=103 RepID=UPI0004086A9A|nr:DUF6371 domain-containing protein [Flectobacillus major]